MGLFTSSEQTKMNANAVDEKYSYPDYQTPIATMALLIAIKSHWWVESWFYLFYGHFKINKFWMQIISKLIVLLIFLFFLFVIIYIPHGIFTKPNLRQRLEQNMQQNPLSNYFVAVWYPPFTLICSGSGRKFSLLGKLCHPSTILHDNLSFFYTSWAHRKNWSILHHHSGDATS